MECQADGSCSSAEEEPEASSVTTCGLYLAESSIPGAGWGVYTGTAREKGDDLDISDVVIPVINLERQSALQWQVHHRDLAPSLLTEYFWAARDTGTYFEGAHDSVESLFPGLGMLPNCHAGLVNMEQMGCRDHHGEESQDNNSSSSRSNSRSPPTAGARSRFQDCRFQTTKALPAGHELFDQYGDDWFEQRTHIFGDAIPLTRDFAKAKWLVSLWQNRDKVDAATGVWSSNGSNNNEMTTTNATLAADLWTLIAENPLLPPRTAAALPHMTPPLQGPVNVAYEHLGRDKVIRSAAWLEEHGVCLDHIVVRPRTARGDRGAFARRPLPQGSVVAPAPLVHLSRHHVEYLYVQAAEDNDNQQTLLWEGHQLLLNYCYGHPDSSLLLLPDSPMVNLIRHYNHSDNEQPNVAIRWSATHPNPPEWMQLTPDQLINNATYNKRSRLYMEFYALSDIAAGDELFLDYGHDWQRAWDRHVTEWESVSLHHADDYVAAWDYERQCDEQLEQAEEGGDDDPTLWDRAVACFANPPSWIQTRCFAGESENKEDEWNDWRAPFGTQLYQGKPYYGGSDATLPCRVVQAEVAAADDDSFATTNFRVHLYTTDPVRDEHFIQLQGVPRSAILVVDRPYTSNQNLRRAFRHEIGLPDEMVPPAWRDLRPIQSEDEHEDDSQQQQCGLFMAESAIPNAGLGMFTANAIPKGARIGSGGMVVQAEDVDVNLKLRHWAAQDFGQAASRDRWLLHMYYWDPAVSIGAFEAEDVQSIIPGLGMLANSHTGLVNLGIKAPQRGSNLQRGRDPGAGASTTFYDVHFDAEEAIEAGAELFVAYGDTWFAEREELGDIPLSTDFAFADRALHKVRNLFSSEEVIVDALQMLLASITSARPRLLNAIPKTYVDFQWALRDGTAALTVPDRVRSVEWLEQNGRCLDNIEPGTSTIRQAGRGAFATRRIKKGDVIAPMPVVHLRRRHMEIYDSDDYNNKEADVWRVGTQLLLNYCYSHPESSLLLFPYAPTVEYVNHNATGFNADLRWSDLPNHHADWLQRTPDDLDSEDHAGLIMEMVATRDIAAGEEVFLNYGSDWESSWNDYVDNWKPTPEKKRPVSSVELNRRLEWLRTESQELPGDGEPYPIPNADDVFTVCFVADLSEATEKSRDDTDGTTHRWTGSEDLFASDAYAYPCTVLERMGSQSGAVDVQNAYDRADSIEPVHLKYRVQLDLDDDEEMVMVDGVPRKAIQFFDRPYMSENTMRDAFRHEIQLPDHMVTEAWRDLQRLEEIQRRKKNRAPIASKRNRR